MLYCYKNVNLKLGVGWAITRPEFDPTRSKEAKYPTRTRPENFEGFLYLTRPVPTRKDHELPDPTRGSIISDPTHPYSKVDNYRYPLQNFFKTYKYCDYTYKNYSCR